MVPVLMVPVLMVLALSTASRPVKLMISLLRLIDDDCSTLGLYWVTEVLQQMPAVLFTCLLMTMCECDVIDH